ncbi:glucose dehydrogenase [FAD, quinone] isoform X1 [Dendroctonus ponderosae]|uniref:glucose dehydrogenase [FAD, quinone] isoform X1 n=1 Tax=Dendroctonus ponderosae TaxID=77166 RepID=UPI002035C7C9|nr:glucose dehydrogenase [FAD, quinone] isoform X1 [Dendroctonus ponderosae]KAH1027456.1 hypothetical protein HUJ05_000959 [Dendroctonus ponderosae]
MHIFHVHKWVAKMVLKRTLVIVLYVTSMFIFGFILKYSDVLSDFLYSLSPIDTRQEFDYIVVGGGSAGSVIANRLARNAQDRVLVLEAGKNTMGLLHIPSVGLLLQGTPFDWSYKTVPQQNACLALNNNVSVWPMGKVLGGTSMLNNMLYVRGHEEDFKEWFKGKEDYSYDDVMAYYKKLEVFGTPKEKDPSRFDAPVFIRDLIFSTDLNNILLKGAKNLGFPVLDTNFNSKLGFNIPKANLHNGKRWTSTDQLKKNTNSNLLIRTNCFVNKVIINVGFEAQGVEYSYLGKKNSAYAKKAVILSAGVIGTPKILMLSGIGRKHHLDDLKIHTVVDLPVGDNLQDHVTTGFDLVLLNNSLSLSLERIVSPFSALEYFFKGSGPWSSTGCEVMAYFDTGSKNVSQKSGRPDLQFMIMPLGITEDSGYYLRKLMGISDLVWSRYFSKIQKKSMTILPVLLHPKSNGIVRLKDKNPSTEPFIDPQYLTNRQDIEVLISGIRLIQNLLKTQPLASFGADFNTHAFPGCEEFPFDSEKYWECYIRQLTITSYHPVGTCKMGRKEDASTVVDFTFQVKGINKLYAVDGSVLPTLPSGNINGPIMMLAEMAADLVKKAHYLSYKQCVLMDLFVPETMC